MKLWEVISLLDSVILNGLFLPAGPKAQINKEEIAPERITADFRIRKSQVICCRTAQPLVCWPFLLQERALKTRPAIVE